MMQKILIFILCLSPSLSMANEITVGRSTRVDAQVKSKEQIYEEITNSIERVGEKVNLSKEKQKEILIDRISSLASWTSSRNKKVSLTSGIFAILNPSKKQLTREELIYSERFEKDNFASGFLYKDYIVTNFHVCRGLNVLVRDYTNKIYGVAVLKYNIKQDVCILKAPEGVKDQRNFASYRMPLDVLEEEKTLFRMQLAADTFKSQNMPALARSVLAEREVLSKELKSFLKESKERKPANDNQAAYSKRSYGQIIGAYGESYIYEINKDTMDDVWKKDNAYTAFGKKCLAGMSGSPIVSANGLQGLFWGAEDKPEVRIANLSTTNPHLKEPACYFVGVEEIEKLITSLPKQ